MTRKTRAQRRESGGYHFSFGSKSKKLIAVAELIDGRWRITDGFAASATQPTKKLGDLKVSWGALATISYGRTDPYPTLGGPPSIRKGPPSITPKPEAPDHGPTCPDCKRPLMGWFDDLPPCRCDMANEVDYTPDPFDSSMYDHATKGGVKVSKSGALDMVYYWMMRNMEYVGTEGVLDSPWKEVQEVLWRTHGYAEYRPDRFAGLDEPGDSGDSGLVTPAEIQESVAEAERTIARLASFAGQSADHAEPSGEVGR